MTKEEIVINDIRSDEFFPNVHPITLESARNVVANKLTGRGIPTFTPEEYMTLYNDLLTRPGVLAID